MWLTACERWKEELTAYLDGELGPVHRWRVRRHLERCPHCADWAHHSQGDIERFRAALQPPAQPEWVEDVMARIRALPAPISAASPARPTVRRRLALAGIAALAVWLLFGGVLGTLRDQSRQAACAQALRKVVQAASVYMEDYDGRLPLAESWDVALASLSEDGFLPTCPLVPPEGPAAGYAFNPALGGARAAALPAGDRVPLLFDGHASRFEARHAGRGNVAFASGAVRSLGRLPEPPGPGPYPASER